MRKINRRSMLLGGAAIGALAAGDKATAFLGHLGGGNLNPAPSGTLLTTRTFVNTSGSSENTPMFAVCFKQGDVPSGTAPIFKTVSGVVIPFSMSSVPSTWPDGSMSIAAFGLIINSGVAGSAMTVKIYSGGTAPSASSRTTADFTAGGLDLNVTVVGQDNLSGTWVSSLAQGITAAHADNYVYMDGAWGKAWRIRASFQQSAADHGYLEGYWYVAALQNVGGTLAGIRHLCKIVPPWIEDHLGPTSPGPTSGTGKMYYSFTAISLMNGGTTLVDFMNQAGGLINYYATSSLSSWVPPASGVPGYFVCSPSIALEAGILVKATSSGLGITSGTTYFFNSVGGTYPNGGGAVTKVRLGTNSGSIVSGGSTITGNNIGGPVTVQGFPYVTWASALYTSQTNGRWNYTQGAGSAATDSAINVQFPGADLVATKLLPPFYLAGASSAFLATPYTLGSAGKMVRYTEQSGDRQDIGMIKEYDIDHLFNQSASAEQNVRCTPYFGSLFPVCIRSKATGSIVPVNNTTYTGMPAPIPNFGWTPTATGFVAPIPSNILLGGVDQVKMSHMANHSWYAFLFTGEPQFMEMLYEWGNNTMTSNAGSVPPTSGSLTNTTYTIKGTSGRNILLGGVNYYGQIASSGQIRTDGWAWRSLACAAAVSTPENPSVKTYFNDIVASNGAFISAFLSALASSGTTYANYTSAEGFFDFAGGTNITENWNMVYVASGLLLIAAITGNVGCLQGAAYTLQYILHDVAIMQACFSATYQRLQMYSQPPYPRTPIDQDILQGNDYRDGSGYWTSGSPTLTFVAGGTPQCSPGLQIGDVVMFTAECPGLSPQCQVPGSFTANVPYYVASLSGTTTNLSFTLSSSPTLSPVIIPTDSSPLDAHGNPVGKTFWFQLLNPQVGTYNGSAYPPQVAGAINYAVAMNAKAVAPPTAPAGEWDAAVAAFTAFVGPPGHYSNWTKYWFGTSFT